MYKKIKFGAWLCLVFMVITSQGFSRKRFEVPEGYTAERDIVYRITPEKELLLDIYYMSDSEKPLPLLIWIHGGAWARGNKNSARFPRHLLGKGYAVAAINYRLSGDAIFPAQIIDCKAAVRWLRANAPFYNVDPKKFAAWGGSAGSHLAALLGTAENMPEWEQGDFMEYSSRVQAVVDWFGPTDFTRMNDQPGKMDHLTADSPESKLIGAAVRDNPDKAAYANPITYVAKTNPPFQIYHGKDDKLVLPNQAILLNDAFLNIGLKSDFAILDSTGHGGKEWNNYIPRAKAFLDSVLINHSKKVKPEADTVKRQRRWTNAYFEIPNGLKYIRFHSQTIGQDYGYMVYLPPSYKHSTKRRFPVIYWLPGRGGNPKGAAHYVELYSQAINDRKAPEAIIVGINGINSSMYTNDLAGNFPIEDVIINDLVPHVDAAYRTLPVREMRAIDGFSMGGFGAARLGFKYPDLFGVVSFIGSAMHKPEVLKDKRTDIFEQVFGGDLEYCTTHSPWTIVKKNAKKLRKDMFIRQHVGENDMLVEKNKVFHELMNDLKIKHEFGIVPEAKHNYKQVYADWDGNPFDFYLKAFGVKLKGEPYKYERATNRPDPTYANVSYGPNERHVIDFWKVDSKKPTPLVVFIHGGGFRQGDKSIVYIHELNEMLKAGISVASINYRLTTTDPLPASFMDSKRAIQFIKTKAKEWHFDKNRMGVYGGSAGAQQSMRIAFHEDMADPDSDDPVLRESTRVKAVGIKGGQISMQDDHWNTWIPGYHSDAPRSLRFGEAVTSPAKGDSLVKEYSAITHYTADDPPIYARYHMAPEDPIPNKKSDVRTWQVHHVNFGVKLQEKAKKLGTEIILDYPGADAKYKSMVEFMKDKL